MCVQQCKNTCSANLLEQNLTQVKWRRRHEKEIKQLQNNPAALKKKKIFNRCTS